ncbi:MAG: UDP-N-acetylmuramate dehydrogenase [Acidobacteriota bacterium]|nr:UDP-N-acetylmuramate dehydrogenase [Acidobacteriota bacterium]
MFTSEEALALLAAIPNLLLLTGEPLSEYTRFGIGGPADIYAQTPDAASFIEALNVARASGLDFVVIGGGTNLIVSDEGFRGIVLKFAARNIEAHGAGSTRIVRADAGAVLQDLVDFTIDGGMKGLQTMTGIPGSVGAAIYGNAGAYGHSISERVQSVRFYDGARERVFSAGECRFQYRESIFKRHKDWIIFATDLQLEIAGRAELREIADGILKIRNEKYPPAMKCAGSIFKNYLISELPAAVVVNIPPKVIREGKVPSAYFLEQVDAKGMRSGDIHVAAYHANLIYNAGRGTAKDLRAIISELKRRVRDKFDIPLEEEVQYVGF